MTSYAAPVRLVGRHRRGAVATPTWYVGRHHRQETFAMTAPTPADTGPATPATTPAPTVAAVPRATRTGSTTTTPPPKPPSPLRKLPPGPTAVAVCALLFLGEMLLWRAGLVVFVWVNVALLVVALVVALVWWLRRRAAKRERTRAARDGRGTVRPGRRPGEGRPGLRGLLDRIRGRGPGGGRGPFGRGGGGGLRGLGRRGGTGGGGLRGLGGRLGGALGRLTGRTPGGRGGGVGSGTGSRGGGGGLLGRLRGGGGGPTGGGAGAGRGGASSRRGGGPGLFGRVGDYLRRSGRDVRDGLAPTDDKKPTKKNKDDKERKTPKGKPDTPPSDTTTTPDETGKTPDAPADQPSEQNAPEETGGNRVTDSRRRAPEAPDPRERVRGGNTGNGGGSGGAHATNRVFGDAARTLVERAQTFDTSSLETWGRGLDNLGAPVRDVAQALSVYANRATVGDVAGAKALVEGILEDVSRLHEVANQLDAHGSRYNTHHAADRERTLINPRPGERTADSDRMRNSG